MRWILVTITVLLIGCSDRTSAPIVPAALDVGTIKTVFVGTTRKQDPNGKYGIHRSSTLDLLKLEISIPPEREPGSISDGVDKPNPQRDFTIASQRSFATPSAFRSALQNAPGSDTEVTVFVHGFNNSFAESSFRTAQLGHDLGLPNALVSYSWASRGNLLGYEYDADSALFARDGLQQLLQNIKASGVSRIVLVGHSMGGAVVMETLRQLEFESPGWSTQNLSGVVLISPDVNADVFLSQTKAFKTFPQPFVVFKSESDAVLRLSAKLRWEDERLGSLRDISPFSHLPIDFIDVTEFDDAGGGNHFVAGSSPALLAILRSSGTISSDFLRGEQKRVTVLPGRKRIVRNATQILVSNGENRR